MKTYQIRYAANRAEFAKRMEEDPWAPIANFPWPCPGHPEAEAMLCHDADGLWVALRAREEKLRAVVTQQNGPVYTDSCLEFFLNPAPDAQDRYINFECNPCGVMLVEVGREKSKRTLVDTIDTRALFGIEALDKVEDYQGGQWTLVYHIPFSFLQELIPEFNPKSHAPMAGNFYKCGDATEAPHWACWNPIDLPQPMFHCPAFFGRLEWAR